MLVPMLGVAAGRMDEAERVVSDMEAKAVRWNAALGARLPAFLASCFLSLSSPRHSPVATHASSSGGYDVSSNEYDAVDEEEGEKEGHVIAIVPRRSTPLREVVGAIFLRYPRHTVLGLSLMVAQAFFYNAIFFSYAIILVEFYGVASEKVGLYLVPFAIGNFLGPITLGPLFDTIGRRQMIALTYSLSAVLLIITGWLFAGGMIGALVQAVLWSVVFFFSSPAASAAYLTVSEIFPLEIRALAISFFYSVGTGLGGVAAPLLFGWLLETGRAENIFYGYVLAAALMLVAAIVETVIGVDAEQKSLESITAPLSAAPAPASPSTGASSLASSTSSLFVSTPHSSSFSSLPLPPQSSLRSSSSSRSHTRPWRAHHDLAALRALGSLTPSYHPHASPSVPPAVSRDEREMDDIDLSEDRQQQQQQQLRPGVPDIPKQLLPAAGSAQHD
ncbi:sugar transport protein [Acanthamoeba castellanii str. Neff]|uniref:Sugar transport protein n=1 Tax=Acanthamoeba castellanii (strain ATCC 30010 / Neff) TaxID=1257118 RepID=L8GFV2_ACACF|nr:sugar transport protein [Acanthamoeba castellanii str. Neff]ELR11056.1 sugar transport protein [Acanthamoeba castellanii str. Neff]